MLKEYGYPEAASQISEHADFTTNIAELAYDAAASALDKKRITTHLLDWKAFRASAHIWQMLRQPCAFSLTSGALN
jgi:hypothetical protein